MELCLVRGPNGHGTDFTFARHDKQHLRLVQIIVENHARLGTIVT